MLQFVQFARSYNITPSVLISANHSTTASGNLAPVHNGITTWIEVKHNAFLLTTNHYIYAFVKFFPSWRNSVLHLCCLGVSISVYHILVTELDKNQVSFLFTSRPFPVYKILQYEQVTITQKILLTLVLTLVSTSPAHLIAFGIIIVTVITIFQQY